MNKNELKFEDIDVNNRDFESREIVVEHRVDD